MGIYSSPELLDWFVKEFPKHSKQKLDIGKSCIRFKKPDQIPFDLIGLLMQIGIPVFAQSGAKISIAIMDFQNTSGKKNLDYLQKSVPEMLITNLAKNERLTIVERSRLQDALQEMQLGMSGIVDQNKAVEVGKAVGANAIMVGSFLDIGGIIRINARLIDTKTSKVIKAESVQGQTGRAIFGLMDQLAVSIENQLVGRPQAERKPDVLEKRPPKKAVVQNKPAVKEKGGSNTFLYIIGGAAIIGAGVAAALLLSKEDDKKNKSETTTIEVIVGLNKGRK